MSITSKVFDKTMKLSYERIRTIFAVFKSTLQSMFMLVLFAKHVLSWYSDSSNGGIPPTTIVKLRLCFWISTISFFKNNLACTETTMKRTRERLLSNSYFVTRIQFLYNHTIKKLLLFLFILSVLIDGNIDQSAVPN